MKKILCLAFPLFLVLLTNQSIAGPKTFNFFQAGYFEGASIVGSFTGEDLDSDGAINSFNSEVSDFSFSFSGNSIVSSFTHTFSELNGLIFVIGTSYLGDDAILGIEGIASGPNHGAGPPHQFSLIGGLGPYSNLGGQVMDNATGALDSTTNLIAVFQVPEPGIILLMVFGLAGLGVARFKKA